MLTVTSLCVGASPLQSGAETPSASVRGISVGPGERDLLLEAEGRESCREEQGQEVGRQGYRWGPLKEEGPGPETREQPAGLCS